MKGAGISLAVVSGKLQNVVSRSLQHFVLSDYFQLIIGVQETLPAKPNAALFVEHIAPRFPAVPREKVLMIGDTRVDQEFAQNSGIDFCSNDYLGIKNHPQIIKSAQIALDNYGFGAGSSRFIKGEHKYYEKLEHSLADFKQTQKALLFSSGYAVNIGAICALIEPGDLVFSDEFNHASLYYLPGTAAIFITDPYDQSGGSFLHHLKQIQSGNNESIPY